MNAAAALGAGHAPPPPARTGTRVDTGPDSRAPASARGARGAASDANAAGSEPADPAHPDARAFSDLLAPSPAAAPARSASVPDAGADPTETPEGPASGDRSPGQLLAMLAGQWLGAQSPDVPDPADTAAAVVTTSAVAATPAAAATSAMAATPAVVAPGAAVRLPGLPAAAAAMLADGPGNPGVSPSAGATPGPVATLSTAPVPTAASVFTANATHAASADATPALALSTAVADGAAASDQTSVAAESLSANHVPDRGLAAPALLAAPRGPVAATPPPAVPLPMPADPATGFDDGFGTRIAWMAEQRLGHAEIRLNPEHVGPIDVRVELDGDRVRAEFQSAHAEVRQAIESSLPRLRELLGQHGLQLGQADIGQRQPGQEGAARGEAPARGLGEARSGDDAPPATATQGRVRGLLDEYA